jgi:hypothetical protein
MNALQSQMAQMQDDILPMERNMTAFEDRLERIETRLGLHDGLHLHT